MRSTFKTSIQGAVLFATSQMFLNDEAKATLYITNGFECLDRESSTISVGDLIEQGINYGEINDRGPHIMLYTKVRNDLISKRLHKAGRHNPISAKKAYGNYTAQVTNDFGEKYLYHVSPVETGLLLEIKTEATKSLVYSRVFTNCKKTR